MTAGYSHRVWWAMQLARDVETCCSLLRGDPVDERSLDPLALQGARQRGAVLLCQVVDLFNLKEVA